METGRPTRAGEVGAVVAAVLCPHCLSRTVMDNPCSTSAAGTVYSIRTCVNCGGAVYAIEGRGPAGFEIIYPTVRDTAPEDYPVQVSENFTEALRSLNSSNFKAAVMMCRSAMQAATRSLDAQGKDLKAEIDNLADRHLIPESLRDWAHEIRDGGNLAAHPEPGKRVEKTDAQELMALAESIFEYLFVIPAQVKKRRERVAEATP